MSQSVNECVLTSRNLRADHGLFEDFLQATHRRELLQRLVLGIFKKAKSRRYMAPTTVVLAACIDGFELTGCLGTSLSHGAGAFFLQEIVIIPADDFIGRTGFFQDTPGEILNTNVKSQDTTRTFLIFTFTIHLWPPIPIVCYVIFFRCIDRRSTVKNSLRNKQNERP